MNLLVPLLAALGVVLIYDGLVGRRGRRGVLMPALERLVIEAGVRSLTAARLMTLCTLVAVMGLVVVAGITSSIVVAVFFAVALAWVPIAVLKTRRERRRHRFREAWPDAIATLIAAVRSGAALPEACTSLAGAGPAELRGGFRSLARTYRASGSFSAALERLANEFADPIADRVVAALSLAHEVGGTELIRALRALGEFVREDLRVRKEVEARWSWTVTAARVAAAAPWIVLLLMATRPEAASAYSSSTGALVIAGSAAATVVGYRLMLRAARLPQERRLYG